jgi:hypothetical protein
LILFLSPAFPNVLKGQGSGFINIFRTRGISALRGGFQISKKGNSRNLEEKLLVVKRGCVEIHCCLLLRRGDWGICPCLKATTADIFVDTGKWRLFV